MSTFVGVVALPMAAGTADARPAAHDPAANYTFSPDNHAPGLEDGAAEHYAVGLEEDLTALHAIVVSSEAFNFADCSAQNTEAFGIDRGNDDPGTQTDEGLVTKYQSISFQEDKIVVEFYKEDGLGQDTVGLKTNDQIVARGVNCYDNPDQKGWYQVQGMLNGSTNDNKKTDYEISVKTHYIYVCDCDSRQEAVEKLGPPPSEQSSDGGSGDGGSGESTPTSSPTAEPDSGSGESTPTSSPTAEPDSGSGDSSGTTTPDSGDGTSETTTTGTDGGSSDDGSATGTPSSTTGTATGGAETTASATGGSNPAGGDAGSTPTENSGPGFGLVAALGALLASGAVALRRRD